MTLGQSNVIGRDGCPAGTTKPFPAAGQVVHTADRFARPGPAAKSFGLRNLPVPLYEMNLVPPDIVNGSAAVDTAAAFEVLPLASTPRVTVSVNGNTTSAVL